MTPAFRPAPEWTSWGRVVRREHRMWRPHGRDALAAWATGSAAPRLAVGAGRSYGDTCLSEAGVVDTGGLDRFIRFDPETGIVAAEAGVTLDALIRVAVPRGWFPAVTPGTRFATLGGAVANDVHGKNHGRAGSFGRHVRRLTIQRSDGRFDASPAEHPELFAATVGGLGLTGVVTEVELQLQPIRSAWLDTETVACPDLDAACDRIEEGARTAEHNVAWIDCTARGRSLGRGIATSAEWAADGGLAVHGHARWSVPTDRVTGLLNPATLRAFNALYHAAGRARAGRGRAHYSSVFYPLDGVRHWNRLYGRRGFFQYQCVLPGMDRAPLRELIARVAASGEGSFLAVLKAFGPQRSPGLLSFPMPGWTFALDFRNRGAATLALLGELDRVVAAAGGRLYPAKDGRMPASLFRDRATLARFERFRDPACRSDFWERMTA